MVVNTVCVHDLAFLCTCFIAGVVDMPAVPIPLGPAPFASYSVLDRVMVGSFKRSSSDQ